MEFKKWFEESQWSGQVAYHGTNMTFNKFDVNKIGQRDWGDFGYGFYLSPTQGLARLYAYDAVKKHGGKPIILSCRLLVQSTANLDEPTLWSKLVQAVNLQPKQGQSRTPQQAKAITTYLQGLGYDSATGRNGREIAVYSSELLRVEGYYDENEEWQTI